MQEYKKFQFLIGIINQILTELLETEIPVFQFLIGIINPSDGLALLRLCLVSIPHRYYKSSVTLHKCIDVCMFQFLIGIINRKPASEFIGPNLEFQFLIGIINLTMRMIIRTSW